jgi:hypothetical protein
MNQPVRIALAFVVLAACARENTNPADSATAETSAARTEWVVLPDSFGPIPLGVPVDLAARALGDSIPVDFSISDQCSQKRAPSLPAGTSLMVIRDSTGTTVERVDVDTAGIRTREGATVGDTEESVVALYAGRVKVQPHKYTGPEGHYVVVTSPRDTSFLIIFETDGKQVLRYRAGRRPAVEYVEGCA